MNNILPILDIGSAIVYAAAAGRTLKVPFEGLRDATFKALIVGALFLQGAAFALRWTIAGYPPVVAWQHAVIFSTMLALAFLTLVSIRSTHWNRLFPAAALYAALLGFWAGTSPAGLDPLPFSLRSGWLFFHASAAALGQGAFLIAGSASTMQLIGGRMARFRQRDEGLEELSIRAMIAAVLFWGGMIVAGALWADDAWGRYWGWDPIEVWSLLIWLLAALHVHVYFAWKSLHGIFLASFAIFLMLLARFALWAIAVLHQTIHWYGR